MSILNLVEISNDSCSPHRLEAEALTLSYLSTGAAALHIDTPAVKTLFDLTGACAGRAQYHYLTQTEIIPTAPFTHKFIIRYNFCLLQQNSASFLQRTVPHEVAHILASAAYGRPAKGHGHYWRHVMQLLGIPSATRCHSYSTAHVKRNRQRQWLYTCDCPEGHPVSTTLHNKMLRGQTRRCTTCKSLITFTGQEILS